MNKAIICGRMAKDPYTKTAQFGQTYTRFPVAVDHPVKQGEERKADFLNCVAWGKTAEFIDKYFDSFTNDTYHGDHEDRLYEEFLAVFEN